MLYEVITIYGFLGPNGAGKTTTMNIITGCLAATEGTVTVDGHDIYLEPIAAKTLYTGGGGLHLAGPNEHVMKA